MDERALVAAFEMLERAGYGPAPYKGAEQMQATMQAWAAVWQGRSAADLRSALTAYMATGRPYWPRPGELLALAPARAPRQLEARTPLERAEQRMGEITAAMYRADPSGQTSHALLDQAVEDTMGACGAPRCIGVGCEPCAVALADRLEELWAQRTMPETARRAS